MLLKVTIAIVVLLGGFLAFIATRPNTFRVERSAVIAAPPAAVFAEINDVRRLHDWSPWRKLDPAAEYRFEGPASGVGAVNRWSGNDNVGAGRQTITESRPNELVRLRLDFERPMESSAMTDFQLQPESGGTRVTWSMYGENNFLAKAMCLFMDQDKMIGEPFEEGLASLKQRVESGAK